MIVTLSETDGWLGGLVHKSDSRVAWREAGYHQS